MFFEDIKIGDKRILPETRVNREEMLAFSKRYNAAFCHVDDAFAAQTRAGAITSPGIYTFAIMWGQYAPDNFGQKQDIGGFDLNMNFYLPVFAGDVLHGVVYVDEKKDRNPYNGAIWVVMEIFNQENKIVLRSRSSSVILKRNAPSSDV